MKQFLNRYFKGDSIIWMMLVALAVISSVAVYSASGTLAYRYRDGNTTYFVLKHIIFILAGFGVTTIVHNIHYRIFSKFSWLFLAISVVLLAITLVSGSNLNEASRWITIPFTGISFQPSEMAKIALVVYIARTLSINQKEGFPASAAFKPIIIATGIVCVLIFPENFSTALLVASISMFMMFIGRVPFKYLLYTVGAAVVMLVFVVILAKQFPDVSVFHRVDTWISRVENFSGEDVDSDKSFQANQAKIAIASGLFPKGPGNSIQRDFLPHPYSDFIFALIIEEYSAVAGIILLFIYLTLLYRAGIIALKCNTTFPAFLIIGIMVTITLQALAHMAVSVNLIPVTGQTLPFVSMGGTSVLFVAFAMGMVLSVSRFSIDADSTEESKNNDITRNADEVY